MARAAIDLTKLNCLLVAINRKQKGISFYIQHTVIVDGKMNAAHTAA